MINIVNVINSLPELLTLKAATAAQITDTEQQLDVKFSDEYKEYLSAFGAIMADGIELSGIAKSNHRNVVALTKQSWELNPKVPHSMYVIEDTRVEGVIIWQDDTGAIYRTSPDVAPQKIANSMEDYILKQTKK